jgi:hypothetical protein
MRELISSVSLRARMIGLALVLFLVLAILVLTGAVAKVGSRQAEVAPARGAPPPAVGRGIPPLDPGQSVALSDQIARLRAMTPALPAITKGPGSITGEATTDPDLYAGEFVKHLLTQNYRTPRAQLLTWVQSEAAQTSEPLVTGLVPPQLRDKWAVFSVTDPAGGLAPIPVTHEWARLAQLQGYTTVEVQRVSEPMAWSSAVSSGRITDAGVTGREVTAMVRLHTVQDGRPRVSASSVALTLNLEGPPVRPDWGFVTAVTYTQIPVTPR